MNHENKKDEKKEYRVTKGSLILRIVVAGYLLYTVYGLSGSLSTTSGMDKIVVIIAMVIFTAVALPLGILSIKAMSGGEYSQGGATEETSEDVVETMDAEAVDVTDENEKESIEENKEDRGQVPENDGTAE